MHQEPHVLGGSGQNAMPDTPRPEDAGAEHPAPPEHRVSGGGEENASTAASRSPGMHGWSTPVHRGSPCSGGGDAQPRGCTPRSPPAACPGAPRSPVPPSGWGRGALGPCSLPGSCGARTPSPLWRGAPGPCLASVGRH